MKEDTIEDIGYILELRFVLYLKVGLHASV